MIRGNPITITVTLLQNGSYGNPVPDQTVHFFDQTFNTQLGSDKTDTNGIASISWIIPLNHALGMTTINATFYGNESLSLAPSCQWTTIIILSSTNIEVYQIPDSLAPGDILSFSVHLTDDSDTAISGATLSVFKNSTLLAVGTTNSSGVTNFEIECNSSWITLGENNIRVVFSQDLVNYQEASEATFLVEIARIPTSITPQDFYPNIVTLNGYWDIYVELSETNNSMLFEPLELFLDNQHLLTTISNSSGIVHFHIDIDHRFTLGTHSLRISYNGTERYLDSHYQILIDVTSPALINIEVPESAEIGRSVEIIFTVSDILGRFIPNSSILIFDTTSEQTFEISSNPSGTTTIFHYDPQGPSGTHILEIEITENLFITDSATTTNFTVWSRPTISLVDCNVEHYASPGQEVVFEIWLTDWAGNCSFKPVHLLVDNIPQLTVVTGSDGHAVLTISVPYIEHGYNISFLYNGNNTQFELSTKYDYNLQITRLMPTRLELDLYETVTPLRKLSVILTVRCFNGSTPSGILVNFNWLDKNFDIESTEGGILSLHLNIPLTSGSYFLYYEIPSSNSISSTSGSFLIEITTSDVMSLEGVGITGIAIALVASVGITAIPILRRKYLVG